jgi:multiple sugar transport system substrate-binding protein
MATVTRRGFLAAALGSVLTACGTASSNGIGPDGRVTIELWHGQSDNAREVIERLVADFERAHPDIHVDMGGAGVIADAMLQKVLAALAAGSYPDIAYIFGSDLASVARGSST